MEAYKEQLSGTSNFISGSLGPDILTKDNERLAQRLQRPFRNSKRQNHKKKRSRKKGHDDAQHSWAD